MDAGELCGRPATGVRATRDAESLLADLMPVVLPHEQSPFRVYLARLGPGSRRTMASALERIAQSRGHAVDRAELFPTVGNPLVWRTLYRSGDTLHAETVILDKRESKSRTDSGIVYFEHHGYNQRNELVCKAKRTGLMMKMPAL